MILAGHTRLEAARQLCLATAPVHIARELTPAQARAYRLMDTGRVGLGIELNPAYVDVAVERWQRFTGKAAVLDGNGGRFDKLRDERVQLPPPMTYPPADRQ